ncbi:helix-turn-helix domain-containing protein [Halarcobacter bivalviorum]|uniref:helix-turn-helix domain-containing protein n=1 Tax=Halarcobacter bivalviorum TaxID=663364 RepID=UPI00100A8201|nr:helix-turn-helix domain-containing protein [Halarcobacter bivalviorum]RXK05369.1 hypothetical protein CRU97_08480 [Halarcobacter bivalviorum]
MKKVELLLIKLKKITNSKTDKELCEKLEINYSTLDTWKNKDRIPEKRLIEFAHKLSINLDELINVDLNLGTSINQGNNSRAGGRDYIEGSEKNEVNNLIPESILIELNSLYERIKNKDEDFVKNVTYEIEDYINEIKRKTRN